MNTNNAIEIKNLKKEFKNFVLNIPELNIPKGFATALIGENGAGKTTLIKCLAGMKNDFKGSIDYFDGETDEKIIRESIGYTSSTSYFMPAWTLNTVSQTSSLLFKNFSPEKFKDLCFKLDLMDSSLKISAMSDGMKMKAGLAAVFARETQMLILDEPASPLDPLMRDSLCNLVRSYLDNGNGEKTVFFSTHNIADMENVTDYAIIMEKGEIVEQGFVPDLKEKYVMVKGEPDEAHKLGKYLIGFSRNSYGCEGLCLAENLDKLAGFDIVTETPTLTQISVGIMKQHTLLGI